MSREGKMEQQAYLTEKRRQERNCAGGVKTSMQYRSGIYQRRQRLSVTANPQLEAAWWSKVFTIKLDKIKSAICM